MTGQLEKAVIIGIDFGDTNFNASFLELEFLVLSAGVSVVGKLSGKRTRPDSTYFIGTGKLEELKTLCEINHADVVIFNHALSPAQQRNIERQLNIKIIDRTALILDIFAQRAHSHEGKIQVELAQLEYLSTRLIRAWTHLERQKGGIGLRGPGETQLETDRRLIGMRIRTLKNQLIRLARQNAIQRRQRQRNQLMTIALVGYTNAGKSSLFNVLTKQKTYTADQLFATLSTTTRKLFINQSIGQVILSDTIGFIRDLPHQLIAAFRATLEETVHADLLLHVVDVSSPERHQHILQVNQVLKEIGADHLPQILVFNKIDLIDELAEQKSLIERDEYGNIVRISVSAKTTQGIEALRLAIAEIVQKRDSHLKYK